MKNGKSYLRLVFLIVCAVPPTITVPPEDIAVEVGETASLHCAAVGIPTPTVEWFLGTTKISEGSTLTIESVNVARGGTYVCLVSSEAGMATALAKLIVFGEAYMQLPRYIEIRMT